MRRFTTYSSRLTPGRRGFTLVEMLVATGLVVLIMTLFATIFQFATKAMAVQKGTAENDQKVRLVMTLLRGDLNNRTMVQVCPFANSVDGESPSDPLPHPSPNFGEREGYFYIAENDPDDDTDDVLQFTTKITNPTSGFDAYYGAARLLLPQDTTLIYGPAGTLTYPAGYPNASNSIPQTGMPQIANPGNYWADQPEFDDKIIGIPDGTGRAPAAEISYFLRHGTLYRRVLLIREGGNPKDTTPANLSLDPFVDPSAAPRNFYTYFDYSGFLQTGSITFHDSNTGGSLDNNSGLFPLGKPNLRFGFNINTGLPREFMTGTDGNQYFIGRFTHEETSYMNPAGAGPIQFFGYPGKISPAGGAFPNPMDPASPLTYNQSTGVVQEYAGGIRVAEDLLMTGVLRFDVKVWDDAAALGPDGQPGVAGFDDDGNLTADDFTEIGWPKSDDGAFRDLGHSGFLFGATDRAFYSRNAVINTQTPPYCPQNANKPAGNFLYRFDTWHPAVNLDGAGATDPPPFRAPNQPEVPALTLPPKHRPLKAIQIRITFFDRTTRQMRDATLVQSLPSSVN